MSIQEVQSQSYVPYREDEIFPEEASWRGKKIEWITSYDLLPSSSPAIYVLATFTLILGSMTIFFLSVPFAVPQLIPASLPMIAMSGFCTYVLGNALVIEFSLHSDSARKRLFGETAEGNILFEEVTKRYGVSAIHSKLFMKFDSEDHRLIEKALLVQAKQNPIAFLNHFEFQYAEFNNLVHELHHYKKPVLQQSLEPILNHWLIKNKVNVQDEIQKNVDKIPIYALLMNYKSLSIVGIQLDKHPKINAFIEKHKAKYFQLELFYKKQQELIAEIAKSGSWKWYQVQSWRERIFSKEKQISISSGLWVDDANFQMQLADQWFVHEIMALENLWKQELLNE